MSKPICKTLELNHVAGLHASDGHNNPGLPLRVLLECGKTLGPAKTFNILSGFDGPDLFTLRPQQGLDWFGRDKCQEGDRGR